MTRTAWRAMLACRACSPRSSRASTGSDPARPARLVAHDVPDTATIEIRCSGRKCFRGVRRRTFPNGIRRASLKRQVRGLKLRRRAVLEVRILRPETIGRVWRYTVGRKIRVRPTVRCLRPGASTPSACPRNRAPDLVPARCVEGLVRTIPWWSVRPATRWKPRRASKPLPRGTRMSSLVTEIRRNAGAILAAALLTALVGSSAPTLPASRGASHRPSGRSPSSPSATRGPRST